jgi:hypothetical protein
METIFERPETASSTPVPKHEVVETWYPTESQRRGLAKLHQLADVFCKSGDAKMAGYQPACRRVLVIGTSGSGKTALAQRFAVERDVPILAVDCGSWLVAGAAARPPTLRIVRDFLRSLKPANGLSGIIFADELCKLVPAGESLNQSAWSLSVFAEAISLLSADSRLAAHEWSVEDIRRLRTHVMIIGGGAFQAALTEVQHAAQRGTLGFTQTSGGGATHATQVSRYLPEEILSRFSSDIIVLQTPTRHDLEEAITRIHTHLGVKRRRPMDELLAEADAALGGVRWIENYVCQLLVEHPYAIRPPPQRETEAPSKSQARTYNLFAGDLSRYAKEATETSSRLQIKLGVIYSKIQAIADRGQALPLGNLLQNPHLGEALIEAVRNCKVCAEVSTNDPEEIQPLAEWRTIAWRALAESSSELDTYGLTELWVEAWSLAGTVLEYRLHLLQAVKGGLLG